MKSIVSSLPFWVEVYKHAENKCRWFSVPWISLLVLPCSSFISLISLFFLLNNSNPHTPTLEHVNVVEARPRQVMWYLMQWKLLGIFESDALNIPSNMGYRIWTHHLWNQARHSTVWPGHQPSHKTFDLQSVLPPRCSAIMVMQNLLEWSTKDLSNLRPTPREGAHSSYCLDDQET